MKTPVPLFILGLGESGQKMLDCERKEDHQQFTCSDAAVVGGDVDKQKGRTSKVDRMKVA